MRPSASRSPIASTRPGLGSGSTSTISFLGDAGNHAVDNNLNIYGSARNRGILYTPSQNMTMVSMDMPLAKQNTSQDYRTVTLKIYQGQGGAFLGTGQVTYSPIPVGDYTARTTMFDSGTNFTTITLDSSVSLSSGTEYLFSFVSSATSGAYGVYIGVNASDQGSGTIWQNCDSDPTCVGSYSAGGNYPIFQLNGTAPPGRPSATGRPVV